MRVAAVYDVHGNLPALRAALADIAREGVSTIVLGGDVASGPLPQRTIAQLMAMGTKLRFVRGNSDREIVEACDSQRLDIHAETEPAMRWAAFAAARVSRAERAFLDSFPPRIAIDIDGVWADPLLPRLPRQ